MRAPKKRPQESARKDPERVDGGGIDPELSDLLRLEAAGLHVENVETDPSVMYMLSPTLRIVYCNRAWDEFAAANGGVGIDRCAVQGTSALDVIAEPLRGFYSNAFERVQSESRPWEHDFECSSAGLFRLFHMRVLPLGASFLLVENSLRIERPHSPDLTDIANSPAYVDEHGIVTMCCHCRRTRRIGSGEIPVWEWVAEFLTNAPGLVSHGLCMNCRAFFYSDPHAWLI